LRRRRRGAAPPVSMDDPARIEASREAARIQATREAARPDATREAARIEAKSAAFAPPPARLADGRIDLVGLSRAELEAVLVEAGMEKFRARQVFHWIYFQGVTDFARMTSIARPAQARLAERFVIGRPGIVRDEHSADGTRKWLLRFRDGEAAETVYIPGTHVEDARGAVSAIPARRPWCATWGLPRSSASSWPRAMPMASGRHRRARRAGSPTSC
jgi:hypothetical protein